VYRFAVKVEQSGKSYVATIPAVPGCVVGGRSREEVLRKAREVLRAFLTHAVPGFSPAGSTPPLPGDGADGEYVELAAPAAVPF
jgi:predicted RNase H-like HicB family nuclease